MPWASIYRFLTLIKARLVPICLLWALVLLSLNTQAADCRRLILQPGSKTSKDDPFKIDRLNKTVQWKSYSAELSRAEYFLFLAVVKLGQQDNPIKITDLYEELRGKSGHSYRLLSRGIRELRDRFLEQDPEFNAISWKGENLFWDPELMREHPRTYNKVTQAHDPRLRFNHEERYFYWKNNPAEQTTKRALEILDLISGQPGQALRYEEIFEQIWGGEYQRLYVPREVAKLVKIFERLEPEYQHIEIGHGIVRWVP